VATPVQAFMTRALHLRAGVRPVAWHGPVQQLASEAEAEGRRCPHAGVDDGRIGDRRRRESTGLRDHTGDNRA
jgi:hypothetical protein